MQPNWIKKVLRHKVKGEENPYSQPKIEQLRSAYREAIPLLDLGVTPLAEIKKRQEVVEALTNKLMRGEPFNGQDKENIGRYHIMLTQEKVMKPDELKKVEKEIRRQTKHNGGDCQKIVSEEELPSILAQGWRVQAVLPSGRVVVSNE
jgi:hypothetical protein